MDAAESGILEFVVVGSAEAIMNFTLIQATVESDRYLLFIAIRDNDKYERRECELRGTHDTARCILTKTDTDSGGHRDDITLCARSGEWPQI